MKFPHTTLLNYSNFSNHIYQKYWIIRCLTRIEITNSFASKFLWFKNYTTKKKIFRTPSKFTLIYSNTFYLKKLSEKEKAFFEKLQHSKKPLKHKNHFSETIEMKTFEAIKYARIKINYKKIFKILSFWKIKKKINLTKKFQEKTQDYFNLSFLKKERLYTKLKYSRVPQYDAVSGGAAALLSGFLGFLITEKFGLELADSGDFWFLFMYFSFFCFFFTPLLKMLDEETLLVSCFSFTWFVNFYSNIFYCFFRFLYYLWKNIKIWN